MVAGIGTGTQRPRVPRNLGWLGVIDLSKLRPIYDDPKIGESTRSPKRARALAATLAQIPDTALAKISETLPISLQHQARISKLFTNQAFRMLFFNLIDVAQRFIAHR